MNGTRPHALAPGARLKPPAISPKSYCFSGYLIAILEIMDHLSPRSEFEAIKAEIEKLSRQIGFVSRALEVAPEHLNVSMTDPCPPTHKQSPGDYCIESGHWPSADQIATLVSRYRAAKSKLERAEQIHACPSNPKSRETKRG